MKKKVFMSLLFFPFIAVGQTEELEENAKIEIGLQGINFGYELPIGNRWLIEPQIGFGGVVDIPSGSSIGYKIGFGEYQNYFSPFVSAHVRYYFNREKRESKGHSLVNNSGSYWGGQTKIVFNEYVDSVLVNDFHFGQQLPLGKNWIFRYNAGFGIGFNLGEGFGIIYPVAGASFGYAF